MNDIDDENADELSFGEGNKKCYIDIDIFTGYNDINNYL